MDSISRRNKLYENVPAEMAILKAITEVEKLPPNEMLTHAVIKLNEALAWVSDYIDEQNRIV